MTTKTDDIKLPELPVGFFKHHIAGFDGPVYAEAQMEAYARAAVEADRRGRMPSDEEAAQFADDHGVYYDQDAAIAGNHARALLSRYGSSQPDPCAEPDWAPNWNAMLAAARNAGWSFTKSEDGIVRMVPLIHGEAQVASASAAPVAQEPDSFRASVQRLCVAARTSGGTAGHDEGLCAALDHVEAMLQDQFAAPVAAQDGPDHD